MVDDQDAVGERVRLLQVLGGEYDRDVAFAQGGHGRPQRLAGPRVHPGRRLVEEQHPRFGDETRGDVEASAHAPGVGGDPPVGGVHQVELDEQLAGPFTGGPAAQAQQTTEQHQVLGSGELLVQGGELPGERDGGAHPGRVADDVVAGDDGPPPAGRDQGREDVDAGRLAGAVRPEQTEDLAVVDGETQPVQGHHRPEGPAQSLDHDRGGTRTGPLGWRDGGGCR